MSLAYSLPPESEIAAVARSRQRLATLAGFDKLPGAWELAAEQQPSPMQQLDWSKACAETLLDRAKLQLLAVGGPTSAAIAPLVSVRRHGARQLEMLGLDELKEPMDLVYSDRDELTRLAEFVLRQGRPVLLGRLPAGSPTIEVFQRVARGRAIVICRPQANCPYIPLDASWREPEQHLNSGRRSDLRRSKRKAEQSGPVKTEILSPTRDESDALLDEAFQIEARSWKGDSGTALAFDQRRASFFRGYARLAAEEGTLRMAFMSIGEKRVAMQLAVESGNAFWLLKVGYDEAFGPCSPGLLLMRDTIAYAAERGLASYELLGKSDAWTQVWTKHEREHVSLRIYPHRPAALWILGCEVLAKSIRRWRGVP